MSRGAPWCPGATLASRGAGDALRGAGDALRGAGDALRGAGKLCERVGIGYDRVSTPADLAPSVFNRIALRRPRWIPVATAHTPLCSARDLVRAAEDGHLTLLRAHAAVAHVNCCCSHPSNA